MANLPSPQNDNLWLVHFLKLGVVRYRSKNYPSDNDRVDVNRVSDNRRQETQCVNGLARSDNSCNSSSESGSCTLPIEEIRHSRLQDNVA